MKGIFLSANLTAIGNVYPDYITKRLQQNVDFVAPMNKFTEDDFVSRADDLKDVEVIFSTWGMPHLETDTIRKYLPSLKAIFYGAGSVQTFAREFIESDITVVSAWAANGVPVAEFTVAQIILANKGYYQTLGRKPVAHKYRGNYNTNVGIIGAGMIGRLVINMLKAYKFNVYVFDPFLSDESAAELGVTKESLAYIFENCDVISNHLANNAQTVGMIDKKVFGLMKPNAAFINTGRGAQVVEADLIAAMKAEPERIALLDVTYPEPPVKDSEFYTLDNVFLSPHIAGSIGAEIERMGEFMCDEFMSYINGQPLKYAVTMKMLETMA